MTGRGIDLSGRWSGVYFYPVDAEVNPFDDWPPTPFTADLEDRGGIISGQTEEPDLMGWEEAPPIVARIEGQHFNGVLTFTKTPQDDRHIHNIDYTGAISADGNTISGTWIIYPDWSGTFQMQRSDVGATAAVEQEVAL